MTGCVNLSILVFVFAAAARVGANRSARHRGCAGDVAAPPANATKTTSGLTTRVMARAKERGHPPKTSRDRPLTPVEDRRPVFDIRDPRQASELGVGGGIAGFGEGCSDGHRREAQLWIPEALAYKGAREPKGMGLRPSS